MDKPHDTLAVIRDAHEKGIVAIACHPGTKIPMFRWKMYQTLMPTLVEQMRWFENPEANVAILTTELVVYDCEQLAAAQLVLGECGDTPHKLLPPRGGIHLGYRHRAGVLVQNKVKIKGLEIDIRTNGGIEMIPPSRTEHGEYRWLDERCGLHRYAPGLLADDVIPEGLIFLCNRDWSEAQRDQRRKLIETGGRQRTFELN